ncbi:DLW-39 family protein [Flexivirga meconopsidis]|nr:DLW-39 family protein [Flexivirga meconopsidis]
MLKKLLLVVGVAAGAVAVKQKMQQQKSTKDLWAQAADQPKQG